MAGGRVAGGTAEAKAEAGRRRWPLRAGGEQPGVLLSGLAAPAPAKVVWLCQLKVPGGHPGHFANKKSRGRMGPARSAWRGAARSILCPMPGLSIARSGQLPGAGGGAGEARAIPAPRRHWQPAAETSSRVTWRTVGHSTFWQLRACFADGLLRRDQQAEGLAPMCSFLCEDRAQRSCGLSKGHAVSGRASCSVKTQAVSCPQALAVAPGSARLGLSPTFNLQLCSPYSGQAAWSRDTGQWGWVGWGGGTWDRLWAAFTSDPNTRGLDKHRALRFQSQPTPSLPRTPRVLPARRGLPRGQQGPGEGHRASWRRLL